MAAIERLSPVYGFGVAIVSFCAFVWLGALARPLSSSFNVSLKDRWKWNNLLVSWIHAVIIGTSCLYVLCAYPEMMQNLVDFHSIVTYTIVAVSAGYFVSDSIDIISCGQTRAMKDVLIHHIAVVGCLAYSIAENEFIAHSVVGLVVEVNSVFLHLRKLMQIVHVGFEHPLYRVVCLLNLISFVLCRFAFSMMLISRALFTYLHRMSTFYAVMLVPTIVIMWIINTVLFWRLFTNDVLRRRRAQQLINNDHALKQQAAPATAAVVKSNSTTPATAAVVKSNGAAFSSPNTKSKTD